MQCDRCLLAPVITDLTISTKMATKIKSTIYQTVDNRSFDKANCSGSFVAASSANSHLGTIASCSGIKQQKKAAPLSFTEKSMFLKCPYCHVTVETVTKYSVGRQSFAVAMMVCAFGGWLFCCLIPLCFKKHKDVVHICPNCKRKIGIYRKNKDHD